MFTTKEEMQRREVEIAAYLKRKHLAALVYVK